MRKFPNYSLLQELTMQGMMVLLIIGYVAYDFMEMWNYYSYLLVAACGAGIILLFRNQIRTMRTAKIIGVITDKKDFKIERNWVFNLSINLLILLLTLVHFYLYHLSGKDFSPLYSEYGVGVLLGGAIWAYDHFKSQIIITEQGVVTGSSLRPSIICWSAIEKAKQSKDTIIIIPKNTFGIKSVVVRGIRSTQQLNTLLRIHNKLK